MSKEAMKLALAVLKSEDTWGSSIREAKEKAIKAIEEALAKQEQGEPLTWLTTQGGAYVCGEYYVVQRVDDKGWNAHKGAEHLLLGASLEDCKSICERDAVESLDKQEQGEPVGFIGDRYNGKMSGSAYPEPMAIWINHLPPIGSVLYTTPQQRKPLTDAQYFEIGQRNQLPSHKIEQIHKELNEAAHGIKE